MKKIWQLPFSLLLLLCFAAPGLAYLQPGSEAPDFKLTDLDGEKVRLSDFKGKIIVLKLGTTWCPDCVGQTNDLMKIGPFLNDSVSKYFKGKEFAMPVVPLLDDGQAHRAYQVYLIPRLVIIDQQFRIVHDGLRLKAEALQEKIAALVKPVQQEAAGPAEKSQPCPSPN